MEIEKGRKYLSKYRALVLKIGRLRAMKSINPEKAGAYENEIEKCTAVRDKIEEEIERTDGGILSEILAQKYICGRSLEEIALIIGYCKRQTERLHLKAIERFCPA